MLQELTQIWINVPNVDTVQPHQIIPHWLEGGPGTKHNFEQSRREQTAPGEVIKENLATAVQFNQLQISDPMTIRHII